MAPAQQLLKLAHGLDKLNTEHSRKPHIHGVIYVHRITDNRMKGSAVDAIRVFEKLIGEDMFDHVVILTNMWDNPPDEAHKRYEDELAKEEEFFGKLINAGANAGGRYRIVKGSTAEQAQSALLDVFVKRPSKIAQIQTEMQKHGVKLGSTSAGRAVRNTVSSMRKDLEDELKDLREYYSEFPSKDPIEQDRMNQAIQDLETKLAALFIQEKLLELSKSWMIWVIWTAATTGAAMAEVVGMISISACSGACVVGAAAPAIGALTVAGATLVYGGIKSFSKWIWNA
ncbi:hypothetical protein RhiTH_005795 [Rhizoctonia solani]